MAKTKKTVKKTVKSTKKVVKKVIKKPVTVSKKNIKKTTVTKKTLKPVVKSKQTTTDRKKGKKLLKNLVLFLAILLLVIATASYFLTSKNDSLKKEPIIFDNNSLNAIVVYDPTCKDCMIDVVLDQLKSNIFSNLNAIKIDYKSANGIDLTEKLNLKYGPTYIFEEKVTQDSKWEILSEAFYNVTYENKTYYVINPKLIPNKVLLKDIATLDGAITLGNQDAKVTVYEFSDYECQFCAIADGSNQDLLNRFKSQMPGYEPPVQKIIENYVNNGTVKFVFYNIPLDSINVKSRTAHNAALCANEQGKWLEFNNKLFENQEAWSLNAYPNKIYNEYAKELDLNITQFDNCLNLNKYDSQINSEIELARSIDIIGTPVFVINRHYVTGAADYFTIQKIIEEELAK